VAVIKSVFSGFELSQEVVSILRSAKHAAKQCTAEELVQVADKAADFDRLLQAEPTVEVLNDSVALAGCFFQALAVQDLYPAAQVFD